MMDRRQMLMRLNSLVEATATGNPAVFNTSVAKPLKSVQIPFTPVQAGSGDPAPDNVRPITGWTGVKAWHTGKNLINPDDMTAGFINIQDGSINQPDNYQEYTTGFIRTYPNMQVTSGYTKLEGESAWQCIGFYTWDKTFISRPTSSNVISSFNTPQNAYWMRISISTWGHGLDGCYATVGTDAAYAPYSGESVEVTFPALGKNLFDKANEESTKSGYIRSTDGKFSNGTSGETTLVSGILPAGTYTISKISSSKFRVGLYSTIPVPGQDCIAFWNASPATATSYTITTNVDGCLAIFCYDGSAETVTVQQLLDSLQIEQGSTATAYEPYTNTVYGGTVDLATGTLTVDRAIHTFTADDAVYGLTDGTNGKRMTYRISDARIPATTQERYEISCNAGVASSRVLSSDSWLVGDCCLYDIGGNASFFYVVPSEYDTIPKAVEYVSGLGLQLCYHLATPIVYHLTPQQITALIGDNVLWSNANADCTVTYLKKK